MSAPSSRRHLMMVLLAVAIALLVSACSSTFSTSSNDDTAAAPTPTAVADGQDVETTAADDTGNGTDVTEEDVEDVNENDADVGPADAPSDIEIAVNEVRPAVVFLAVELETVGPFGLPEEQEGVGSGFIFNEDGHILTNNHVIEGAATINVVLPDGRGFEGDVVGRSPEQDLAIVELDTDEDLPVIPLGNSEDLRIGQSVIAIGNALGLPGGPTVTTGVVSAVGRTIQPDFNMPPMENLIQTDAAINPGNSGGPLINLNGEVIGINTAGALGAEGIGFAVSIDTARQFIQQVVEQDPQPFIGISGFDVTPAVATQYQLPVDQGVLIVEVSPNTPAEEADIQSGDILLAMNNAEIQTVQQLQSTLDEYDPGDEVILLLNRDGSEIEVALTLGESPIIQ